MCVRALLTSSSSSSSVAAGAGAAAGVVAGGGAGACETGLWKNGSSPFSSSTLSDELRE